MNLKHIWQRLIAWLTFKKTKSEDSFATNNSLDPLPTLKLAVKKKTMQDFIEEKKIRKPFYKDDNKKTWE